MIEVPGDEAARYRDATEALHRDVRISRRYERRGQILWQCGLANLIRADFQGLLGLIPGQTGNLLDAGCGTGIEFDNFRQGYPYLRFYGVDISSVALAEAIKRPEAGAAQFSQAALEHLPFSDSVFDFITSHEVIEHVEDPAVVLGEFYRVLKPGGVCVIATPNGSSWWMEHLRQRLMRLIGRRGAPVGADHVRPPSFWILQFRRMGFLIEQHIFDGAAFDFQLMILPPAWMPAFCRIYEPLRSVPLVKLWLCDRVKFKLKKPGQLLGETGVITACCPLCREMMLEDGPTCRNGHHFARNAIGLVDFTRPLNGSFGSHVDDRAFRPGSKFVRRTMQLAFLPVTLLLLLLLLPVGLLVSRFYQPLLSYNQSGKN